ncbi:hypothetical protein FD755_005449 [Muntiacus reevesi]|uniref:C2 domain-containing protein n=1 Tax=Muntiacus reevesi TaxID=9886 RepID=A0A5J5MVL5_MUNRE|nr:hypothetical protein FD755_005449 [Muntiacus reevesi]
MALTVCVRRLTGLPGTHDRQVRLSFRGFTQKMRRIHCGREADISERGKHLTNIHGTSLIVPWLRFHAPKAGKELFDPYTLAWEIPWTEECGKLQFRESMGLQRVQVELDLKYQPPEGATGVWAQEDFGAPIRDSSELIIPNVGFQELEPGEARLEWQAVALGRRLARGAGQQDDEDDKLELELDDEPDVELSGVVFSQLKSRAQGLACGDPFQVSRAQDFQVGVTVLEAQKLVGVNNNPYVAVRVGEQRRVTATQRGTNFYFYNKYFLFEFHETRLHLQSLLLEITAFHSQTLPFMATRIGTFRMDLGMIFDQPGTYSCSSLLSRTLTPVIVRHSNPSLHDHPARPKWAPLHDPRDTRAGTKGFVKVTLSVRARGDLPPPLPPPDPGHSSNVEKNLLLPRRVPAERPWARLRVRVYRAEGLPALRPGLLGSLAHALLDQRVPVGPYVRVSFLGQQGEMSVHSETMALEWNEQLSFLELFPPLTRGLRLQPRDDTPLVDAALATHVLDLTQTSHSGRAAGFNPTFGPAWVPLYGSPPSTGLRDGFQNLNEGVGQGICFRGRLLVAVSMEVLEGRTEPEPPQAPQGSRLSQLTGKKKKKARHGQIPTGIQQHRDASSSVDVPEIPSAVENALAPCEDFLLFAVLFEATMIDPAMDAQPISFETSIGDAGRRKEQLSQGSRAGEEAEDTEGEEQLLLESDMGVGPVEEEEELGTPAQRPEPMDGSGPYFCLPLRHRKPCVSVWSRWENHLWRLQSSNCVRRVAERLDQGLQEVETLQRPPGPGACTRLKQALGELVAGSRQFCHGAERRTMTRPNTLDRCRGKLLVYSLNLLAKQGLWLLRGLRQRNVPEKVALAKKLLVKLHFLAQEPQSPLPGVLVWMLSGWCRDVLFSVVEEERDRDCGKIQSLLLTAPGAAPGEVFAKLELFLWLRLGKQATACTAELPVDLLPESSAGLPHSLYRDDFSYFQLRAHLYQARGVLAADDKGSPDTSRCYLPPCTAIKVLEQKLSPLWDELLVFDQLTMDGRREHLQDEPPVVIVNVLDHNKFGPDVFLGRALPAPRVKLMEDTYQPPELQFFPLRKGSPGQQGSSSPPLSSLNWTTVAGLSPDLTSLPPSVPSDVEPRDLTLLAEPLSGRLSLPPHVHPGVGILFRGLRGLGSVHLLEVEQPQVVLEVAGRRVESEVLASYYENPNFTELIKHLTVDLPEQPYLQPPLSILVIERRAFGRTVLVGSHVIPHMLRFTLRGQEDAPEEQEEEEAGDLVPKEPQGQRSLDPFRANMGTPRQFLKAPLKKLPLGGLLNQGPGLEEDIPEPEELDWWSKYYASLQELQGQANFDEDEMDDPGDSDGVHPISVDGEAHDQSEPEVKGSVSQKKALATLKIYNTALEEEFDHFEDWLNVFPCTLGRGVRVEMERMKGLESLWASSRYATNLAPADPNGKADRCVVVSAGREQLDTKERYIPRQLNPIFGEVLELSISLPAEPELTVTVFDHDLVGSDDLIGETHIDLENRFYSHYRANCGLASQYDAPSVSARRDGYNAWRDAFRPLQILAGLCQFEAVKAGSKLFLTPPETLPPGIRGSKAAKDVSEEAQALLLVPEHVETRPLYHPRSPGLLQVKEGSGDVPAPPPSENPPPNTSLSYELRVIIWNTEDVVLDDVNRLTGEMSRDVHFNSLTGEGNFNWRFVFRFDYLPMECEVSIWRRPGPFALEEAEFRQPAVLVLQVSDYDHISANDFLGSLELQLPDMRGAWGPELCSVRLAQDGAAPRCNFCRSWRNEEREQRAAQTGRKKRKKRKGQWGDLRGKVEAEFELLTVEEVEKRPVGKGRKEPEPLEKPDRPKTSFNWFVNPLKTFVFFIWHRYWCTLVLLLLLITVFLLLVFLRHARADKPGHLLPPPPPLTHGGHSSHNPSSCLLPTDKKPFWGSRFLCPNLPGNPPLLPAHPQQIRNNPNNAWGRE